MMRWLYTTVLLSVITIHNLSAQTDNYWSWTFNTPSTLLAGAVVGGNAGASAIYYNPALIDKEDVLSLSLSASLVSLQWFRADDIAGEGLDANRFIFKIQPRFISFFLNAKNPKLGVEAAILSTISEEIPFTLQYNDTLNILSQVEGEEFYSGYLSYRKRYDDTWAGIGMSYEILPNFSIGGSFFVSTKTLKYDFVTDAKAYPGMDSVILFNEAAPTFFAQNTFSEELKYWHISLITKLGLQYQSKNGRFGFGANLTFPGINVYGQADVRRSYSRGNVYDEVSQLSTKNVFIVDDDLGVRTNLKSPFSTAVGVLYSTQNRKNLISVSAEYFAGIDEYSMLRNEPSAFNDLIASETPFDTDFLSFYHSANPVTNVGFGWKQFISEKLSFLGGFRTDFSSQPNNDFRLLGEKFTLNRILLNKYHITGGNIIVFKKIALLVGVQYTRARNRDYQQVINYSDPIQYNNLTKQGLEGIKENTASVKLDELGLYFGVKIDFNGDQ